MVRGRRDQREFSSVCNRTDLRKDGKEEVEAKNLILNYPGLGGSTRARRRKDFSAPKKVKARGRGLAFKSGDAEG